MIPLSMRARVVDALKVCDPVSHVHIRLEETHVCSQWSSPEVEHQPEHEQHYSFTFKIGATHVSRVLKTLKMAGVGEAFGEIDVLAVLVSARQEEQEAVPAASECNLQPPRLPTLEIHASIVGAARMDMDHILLVAMASAIAAIGLLADSSPDILAAFFISPLMSMIVAVTWGLTIGDMKLVRVGFRNMLVGILISFSIGVIAGLIVSINPNPKALECPTSARVGSECYSFVDSMWFGISINSAEILSRGPPWSNIALSAPVAAFSGVAIALGHSSGIASALAGCAMSTSLLPPIVNAGLMFGLHAGYSDLRTKTGSSLLRVAWYSMLAYLVNVFFIILCTFATFKWKHIGGKTLRKMRPASADDLGLGVDLHGFTQSEGSPQGSQAVSQNLLTADSLNTMIYEEDATERECFDSMSFSSRSELNANFNLRVRHTSQN